MDMLRCLDKADLREIGLNIGEAAYIYKRAQAQKSLEPELTNNVVEETVEETQTKMLKKVLQGKMSEPLFSKHGLTRAGVICVVAEASLIEDNAVAATELAFGWMSLSRLSQLNDFSFPQAPPMTCTPIEAQDWLLAFSRSAGEVLIKARGKKHSKRSKFEQGILSQVSNHKATMTPDTGRSERSTPNRRKAEVEEGSVSKHLKGSEDHHVAENVSPMIALPALGVVPDLPSFDSTAASSAAPADVAGDLEVVHHVGGRRCAVKVKIEHDEHSGEASRKDTTPAERVLNGSDHEEMASLDLARMASLEGRRLERMVAEDAADKRLAMGDLTELWELDEDWMAWFEPRAVAWLEAWEAKRLLRSMLRLKRQFWKDHKEPVTKYFDAFAERVRSSSDAELTELISQQMEKLCTVQSFGCVLPDLFAPFATVGTRCSLDITTVIS